MSVWALGSLLTGIVAMDQFQEVFHSGKTGPTVSLLFSLYTVLVFSRKKIGSYAGINFLFKLVAQSWARPSPLSFQTNSAVVRPCLPAV